MDIIQKVLRDCLNEPQAKETINTAVQRWQEHKLEIEALRACVKCLKSRTERVCEVCIYNDLINKEKDSPCLFV